MMKGGLNKMINLIMTVGLVILGGFTIVFVIGAIVLVIACNYSVDNNKNK
jgi:hypothetical protein